MFDVTKLPGIQQLWSQTKGNPKICVAILDGLVDQTHPCFEGANLKQLSTLVQGKASLKGIMSTHRTHVTSVIFGQPNSPLLELHQNVKD